MTVVVNEAVLATFLRSPFGPVGRDLAARAEAVYHEASQNATGAVVGVRTQDLLNGLSARLEQDSRGLIARVGSNAVHRGTTYGPIVHRAGDRPGAWLRGALAVGYLEGLRARSR